MEGQSVKVVAVMATFVMIFLGQATARFDKCYAKCYFDCILDMKKTIPYVPKKFLPCAWKCTKKCIFHPASTHIYYCKLGCTLDSCADFCEGTLSCPFFTSLATSDFLSFLQSYF